MGDETDAIGEYCTIIEAVILFDTSVTNGKGQPGIFYISIPKSYLKDNILVKASIR